MDIKAQRLERSKRTPPLKRWILRNYFNFWLVAFLVVALVIGLATAAFASIEPKSKKVVTYLNQEPEKRIPLRPATTTTTVAPTTTQVQPKATQPPVAQTVPQSLPAGSHTDWMAQAGIPESDWGYVDHIISKESGWRPHAVNPSNCIGLGQNCPSNGVYFLPLACPNWQNDPVCQLRRFTEYAGKYGGWAGSYRYWLSNGNW